MQHIKVSYYSTIQRHLNMYKVTGKIALVTGGASGIGFSTAKALLDNGLKGLVLADLDEENGKKAAQILNEQYGKDKSVFMKLDVRDRSQFEDAFRRTVDAFHNLDIVVNGAGLLSEKNWEKAIATNLTGTVTGTVLAFEQFLPKYRTEIDAVVLNVCSVCGVRTYSSTPVYNATKHGVAALTKSFGTALHYERTKIRVMAICPGITNTKFFSRKDFDFLGEAYQDAVKSDFSKFYKQNVNSVSKAIVHVIRTGKSGSLWVVEDDHDPYEFKSSSRE